MPDPAVNSPNYSPAVLRSLRGMLAVTPVLLGAFAYWHAANGPAAPVGATGPGRIAAIAYGFCVLAAASVFAVRAVRARQQPAARPPFSIVGWAVGEGAALFGAAVILLGGGPWAWMLGMLVVVLSWLQIPVDPQEA